jgi:hypothetical protein
LLLHLSHIGVLAQLDKAAVVLIVGI